MALGLNYSRDRQVWVWLLLFYWLLCPTNEWLNESIDVCRLVRMQVKCGSFFARDNVSNFIQWCRLVGVYECLLFETDDLVLRKNEKSLIVCLLEVIDLFDLFIIWFDLIFFVACYADFNVGLVLFPPRTDEFQSASCGFQMSLRVRSMGSVARSFKPLPTPRFTALFFGTVSEQFQSSCSYFGTVSCINEHDLSLFQWI